MTDLEAEREQKQRDFDRKLLLAKSKIEIEEASVTPVPCFSTPLPFSHQSMESVSQGWSQEAWVLAQVLKSCVTKGRGIFLPCASVSL